MRKKAEYLMRRRAFKIARTPVHFPAKVLNDLNDPNDLKVFKDFKDLVIIIRQSQTIFSYLCP